MSTHTLTIQTENRSLLTSLKKILETMNGVSIVSPVKNKRKSGIEEAMEDVRQGRVSEYKSADDLFEKLGI